MARPPSSIDKHRDYVTHLYLNGVSRRRIQYKLRKHHHVTVNLSTISRRIASWDLPRQQARTKESPELIEATRDLIFRVGLSEKQTLSGLQRQGWPITKEGLKRIRLHPDRRWVRRINSDEERLAVLEKTEQVIIDMTQRSNAISGYGKSLLQPYLRQQKQLWVPRDPLFAMYKIMRAPPAAMRKAVHTIVLPKALFGTEIRYPGPTRPGKQRVNGTFPRVRNGLQDTIGKLQVAINSAIRGALPVWKTTPIEAMLRESNSAHSTKGTP
ncbi:hypothetical protein HYQ46_005209 [Verticillium longisporum]|nr:hypothetical protein HYQ46_005209 [Verticillium longisporum]